MKKRNRFVVLLLFPLLVAFFLSVGFVPTVKAQSWTDITLPYTISASGNYRITAPYTGSDNPALEVSASNVVVDGQNYLLTGTNAVSLQSIIMLDSEALNVFFKNINETSTGIGYGLFADSASNFTVANCTIKDNSAHGLWVAYASDFTVANCTIKDNEGNAVYAYYGSDFTVVNSILSNSKIGVSIRSARNFTIANNIISNNYHEAFEGGLQIQDCNGTVSNNTFQNNYDAITFLSYNGESNSLKVYGNIFAGNSFTFCFDHELENSDLSHTYLLYNNIVNDSVYFDPDGFESYASGDYLPFNDEVLMFNVTQQAGTRIYGAGTEIGGNFWAYPNGTGYSQITADLNHDGFCDFPFDLFGNATIYDYLPLSLDYVAPATPTPAPSSTPLVTPPVITSGVSFDWFVVVVLVFEVVLCFVVMGWFNRIPLFGIVVGLFTVLSSFYFAVVSWGASFGAGLFGLFCGLVGVFVMLFSALGVRVRGRR